MTKSHFDEWIASGHIVYELFPPRWLVRSPPLSTVGRLDRDTTGLLLLTDDGAVLLRSVAANAPLVSLNDVSWPIRTTHQWMSAWSMATSYASVRQTSSFVFVSVGTASASVWPRHRRFGVTRARVC